MREVNGSGQEQIEGTLEPVKLWQEALYMPIVNSTNDMAKRFAALDAPDGTLIVANEQTDGRGRLNRRWLAPPGTCLLCSLLFRPPLSPSQANRLTMLCALAAADAIEETAQLRPLLKWPNDLIIESRNPQSTTRNWRKLAGLLTETGIVEDRLDFVVVGIGININVPPEMLPDLDPNATSILAETGREVNLAPLLDALLSGVEARYERLRAGESPHREWAARLVTLGRPVEVTTSGEVLTGVAESVDEDGALLLRTPDGALQRCLTGDVTLARS